MQYRESSVSPMSSSVTILLVWYVVFLSENQTSPAFGDVCIKNCLRITCILGSHKMKGILRVILPEEPDLEGNISQLGGKYYNISLACIYHTKKRVVHVLAYRLHDKLQSWNEHTVPTGFIAKLQPWNEQIVPIGISTQKSRLKSNISSRSSRNTKQFRMFSLTSYFVLWSIICTIHFWHKEWPKSTVQLKNTAHYTTIPDNKACLALSMDYQLVSLIVIRLN